MVYIAIDFETTGLSCFGNQIIEIGAVKFNADGEELGEYQKLIKPSCKIETGAKRVHKITEKMLENESTIDHVWQEFIDWCGDFDAFVAHNAPFEAGFVSQLYDQKELPDFKFIDTLKLARTRAPGLPGYKLTDLVPDLENPHRALPDATGTAALLLKLIDTYKSKKLPKTQIKSIFDLLPKEKSNEPTRKQLGYIKALGGDPSSVETKQEASEYIVKLQRDSEPNRKKSNNKDSYTKQASTISKVLTFVGVVLMPYIFAWFTLKPGFSNKARLYSFAWAAFLVYFTFFKT